MKINQIKIKNFKSLKYVDVKLANLTLVTGVNSVGKSSFIQSLLLLKQNQENIKMIASINGMKDMIKDDKHLEALQILLADNALFVLNGSYVELGSKQDILYQEVYEEDIHIEFFNDDNSLKASFNTALELTVEENKKNKNDSFNLFYDDFQYICTDRMSPTIIYPLSELNVKNNLIGLRGEYTAHYLAENRHQKLKIDSLRHEKSQTNHLLENVSLWLNEISNGIEVSAKIYRELQQVSLTYKYTYGENTTNDFSPLNVGFGITYVLPIIVSILKAQPGDLLIIENPESHLHPAGQSKIAKLCAIASSCGVQIIVETHSDHFLNGVRVATKKEIIKPEDSQVYYFRKNENELATKIDKINIDKDGKIPEWPIGFFDEWDNQLDELLW